jgi:uncharacterized protein DUF6982
MTKARAASLALVTPAPSLFDVKPVVGDRASSRGSDRRIHTRLTPVELQRPLTARLKYGEDVTLVDLSAGGALVETSKILRPDTDLVLEILDPRTSDVTRVVSRVLRSQVSGLSGGVTYRGACVFKHPFSHPALVAVPAPPPLLKTDAGDFVKLEFALKTIVEGYFKRPTASGSSGRWRDGSALLDALVRLRTAAERRESPIDRQLAQLLAAIIPALQRDDSVESAMGLLQDQLCRYLPLLAIHANSQGRATAHDRERVTLNMCTEADQPPVSVTAEFAAGFGLDESQFRLLKASAYLVGLVGNWRAPTPQPVAPVPPLAAIAEVLEPATPELQDLPVGWHRLVVRYVDGQLLRGYSNDFHPDRAHLHLCPTVKSTADERLLVPVVRLKAVFFVKTLQGDPDRVDANTFDHNPRARKVEVTFRDGEVMVGSTLNYKPTGQGFFLQPASSRSNNVRIYVVTPAIRHMRFV